MSENAPFGGRDGVPGPSVHHDIQPRRSIDVDIIHTDACATDHLELLRGVDEPGRGLGLAVTTSAENSLMISSNCLPQPGLDRDVEKTTRGEFAHPLSEIGSAMGTSV